MRNSGSLTLQNILLLLQFLLVYFTAFSHAGNKVQGNCKKTYFSCKIRLQIDQYECVEVKKTPWSCVKFLYDGLPFSFSQNKLCNLAYSGIYAMYVGTECTAY